MARRIKGIGTRRMDETAYYKAVKSKILAPMRKQLISDVGFDIAFKGAFDRLVTETLEVSDDVVDAIVTDVLENLKNSHKSRMIQEFKTALEIDITPVMSDITVRPFLEQKIRENVNLIKTIPEQLHKQLLAGIDKIFVEQGFNQQAVNDLLVAKFDSAANRAKVITRDQTEKIIGNLNQIRQTSLGIKSYIWQTAEDERVVGEPGGLYPKGNSKHMNHAERNGKEFLWAVPPPDGYPGHAIHCRCVAIPVIQGSTLNV